MHIEKIYISGKITGLPIGEVIRKFRAAEAEIRRFGFEPVSPLRNGLPLASEWADHMGRDVALLLRCDAIYLLPDWRQSEGALLEHLVARHRRMRIFRAETFDAALRLEQQKALGDPAADSGPTAAANRTPAADGGPAATANRTPAARPGQPAAADTSAAAHPAATTSRTPAARPRQPATTSGPAAAENAPAPGQPATTGGPAAARAGQPATAESHAEKA